LIFLDILAIKQEFTLNGGILCYNIGTMNLSEIGKRLHPDKNHLVFRNFGHRAPSPASGTTFETTNTYGVLVKAGQEITEGTPLVKTSIETGSKYDEYKGRDIEVRSIKPQTKLMVETGRGVSAEDLSASDWCVLVVPENVITTKYEPDPREAPDKRPGMEISVSDPEMEM
jgi:hypothetical protein